MTPSEPPAPATQPPPEPPPAPQRYSWFHRFTAVVFATLCLEIGFFLLVFPWTDYATHFAAFRPGWRIYWDNAYVRGAISGVGLVNLYIAVAEIIRLRRFAR
jgi:hypothetical protein